MLGLEGAVRPPRHASPVEIDRLGEELVAVLAQAVDVDLAALHRPEPAAAGFVAQIAGPIGRADEQALPRLVHFVPP